MNCDFWECKRCSPPSNNVHVVSSEIKSLISSLNLLPTSLDTIDEDDENEENFLSISVNCKYYELHEFKDIQNKSKFFSALHLNISSLDKHFDKLHTLLAETNHQFEIIGLTETRLSESIKNSRKYSIQNYKIEDKPTQASAGGAMLYIADHLPFIPREDLSNEIYLAKSIESVFVEICEPKKKNVIVGCIYRHHTISTDDFNVNYLAPLLAKVSNENKTLMLLGDFNVDLLKADSDQPVSRFLDTMSSYLLLP